MLVLKIKTNILLFKLYIEVLDIQLTKMAVFNMVVFHLPSSMQYM